MHLIENYRKCSLIDLIDLHQQRMMPFLTQVAENYITHITSCETCRGKGFFCEICDSDELLFAFQLKKVTKCPKCKALYHRECFNPLSSECPRCKRMSVIKGKLSWILWYVWFQKTRTKPNSQTVYVYLTSLTFFGACRLSENRIETKLALTFLNKCQSHFWKSSVLKGNK